MSEERQCYCYYQFMRQRQNCTLSSSLYIRSTNEFLILLMSKKISQNVFPPKTIFNC